MSVDQLNLFEKDTCELDALWQALVELKDSSNRTRKRLFGEIKELNERITELQATNERLKYKQHQDIKLWSA